MQPRVLGFVHHAHPTAAQLFDDAVVRDGLPDHRRNAMASGRASQTQVPCDQAPVTNSACFRMGVSGSVCRLSRRKDSNPRHPFGTAVFKMYPSPPPSFVFNELRSSSLSRPAQASLALRPAELLTPHTWAWLRRRHRTRFPSCGAR